MKGLILPKRSLRPQQVIFPHATATYFPDAECIFVRPTSVSRPNLSKCHRLTLVIVFGQSDYRPLGNSIPGMGSSTQSETLQVAACATKDRLFEALAKEALKKSGPETASWQRQLLGNVLKLPPLLLMVDAVYAQLILVENCS